MAQARTQSNAMLYSLITFVALFVVGVVLAAIFYIKSEEYRTQLEGNKSEMLKIANAREQSSLSKIVGKIEGSKTYIGTLNGYYNKLVSIVTGAAAGEEVSAEAKWNDITTQINKLNQSLGSDVSAAVGPDSISLLKQITDLQTKLNDARAQSTTFSTLLQKLQDEFNAAKKENDFKEQQLVEQVQKHQQSANEVQAKYDDLQKQMTAAADEQIQTINKRLEEEQAKLRQKQLELTQTQQKLEQTSLFLKEALAKMEAIRPRPDKNVSAYQPDAGILRVDLQNERVYLDAGAENHVYPGLTFAVYDRNKPVPEDGHGKAEIEVFQVESKVSVARIIKSDKKNPIVKEDIVANLIWDSKTSNRFVVIGEFGFNNDERIDADGAKRIREMIERWGGTIDDNVSINTDFVIVGLAPHPLPSPEQAQLDIDPTLQQKYKDSLKAVETYNARLARTGELSVPVFNQKQFLYLVGHNALLENAAAK